MQGIADVHGFPHGIVGFADLSRPDVTDILDGHLQQANFRGVRGSMNYHLEKAKTYQTRPEVSRTTEWRRGFAEVRNRGLSFDLQLYYPQMQEFFELASDFPDVQILLNHTGMQVDGPDHFGPWREGMAPWRRHRTSHARSPGSAWVTTTGRRNPSRPTSRPRSILSGSSRCMFASNFPVDKLFSSYSEVFDAFREITDGYSESEKWALFHDNAQRYYRL